MQFTKMHGIGNDFVMIDALGSLGEALLREAEQRSVWLCDRKFGVGADGVILILPSSSADFRMRMFNPDGSEAEMCGNGIRCFAKFAYDKGITKKTTLNIETGAGVLETVAHVSGGLVDAVTVDMGEAHLAPTEIPVQLPGLRNGNVVAAPLQVDGADYAVTCVS
ncbi:MAG TPA: diaminopimelate epimerase, partial [Capsulimonadaceae bacterium]|nr:diaminopimelate epimerase [Capsulimonadaceae bacterium]